MITKKSSRKLPNFFNKEQLTNLIEGADDPQVMVAILLGTFCGLRIGEVVRLKKEDIDFDRKTLKVVNGKLAGKNDYGYGKDRVVPIPTSIATLLQTWCGTLHGAYILESIYSLNNPMCLQHLFKKYRNLLIKTGLSIKDRENSRGKPMYRYNFHTLRHTYATLLWEKSGDIYAVKQALGHVKLDTTLIYTHITDKSLQKKIENAFEGTKITYTKPKEERPAIAIENQNPLNVIKVRLARGEISIDKFNQLMGALSK